MYTTENKSKKFLGVVQKLALHQCVKNPTREKNILDLVFVYDNLMISKIEFLAPLAKSDHSALLIRLNVKSKIQKKVVTGYKYDKANYNILQDRINKINWEEEVRVKSVDENWKTLIKILINFRENNIKKTSREMGDIPPWLNNKIMRLIKKRNNLFKRYKNVLF